MESSQQQQKQSDSSSDLETPRPHIEEDTPGYELPASDEEVKEVDSNKKEESIKQQKQNNAKIDCQCPICLDLMIQPCYLPCKHVFCYQCLDNLLDQSLICPMCREEIDIKFVPKVDKKLKEKIHEEQKDAFDQKQEAFNKEQKQFEDKVKIKFLYGNLYKKSGSKKFPHLWTMFVESLGDFQKKENQLIEKVIFRLHESYKKPNLTVNTFPFKLSRKAWGYFEIKVTVHWKKYLKMKPTVQKHDLVFEKKGSKSVFSITVLKKLLPKTLKSKVSVKQSKVKRKFQRQKKQKQRMRY